MNLLLVLILSSSCLAALSPDEEIKREWLSFNQKYNKKHRSSKEAGNSFRNFKRNVARIMRHNKRFERKQAAYKMEINAFADMTLKEMQRYYMGLKITRRAKQNFHKIPKVRTTNRKKSRYASYMDWRDSGAVTPVKHQLNCGSCWAFASTGALEAHYFLKHNRSVVLSEQNLVDCVSDNYGCEGGWIIPSFEYVRDNGGINSEYTYPYEAIDCECRFQSQDIAATCNGYQGISQGDEQHLLEVVATTGPVAVAIEVNDNFIYYKGGVYVDHSCTDSVNHAVLVVGYGTEDGQDYWLVKNSWGTEWGLNGYIKMARNAGNQCGIALYGVYPLV